MGGISVDESVVSNWPSGFR